MRGRLIVGPALALALGFGAIGVGLRAADHAALGAQSAVETATPAHGKGGGNKDKGNAAKANAAQDLTAAFHTGTCRKPDEPAAFTLAALAPQINDAGTPTAQGTLQGELTTPPLVTGTGSAAVPFTTLVNAQQPYVLVIHSGKDATGPAVACGDVAGVAVNGQLALALRPEGNDGYAGIAVLAPTNDGGTAGTLFVFSESATANAAKTLVAKGAAKGNAQGAGGGRGAAATGGGGWGRAQSGGSGGGRGGQGGQGGQAAGAAAPISGGLAQGAATRVPRANRTPTVVAEMTATAPAESTAPSAPATEGTPPVATETTGLENPAATISAIETATIATVAPEPTTATEPTAATTETEPTVATSDVVEPTVAAPETAGTPGT